VFQLGGKLLDALKAGRLSREDENVKGISWFLICVGESLEKGAYQKAKEIYVSQAGNSAATPSLGVAFCLKGCEINDWAAGMVQRKRKGKTSVPSDDS
jgi:hypothetical protein